MISKLKSLIWIILISLIAVPGYCGVIYDGIDDGITLTDGGLGNLGSGLDRNNTYCSAWIKTTNTTDFIGIIGVANSTGNDTWWACYINRTDGNDTVDGAISVVLRDEDNNFLSKGFNTDSGVTDGALHHLLFRTEGDTNVCKIWLDGSELSLHTEFAGTPDNTANFDVSNVIGGVNWKGSVGSYWNGEITEMAIWQMNGTLTATEIANLASSRLKGMPLQIQPANLKAYWSLDDEEAGTSCDGDTFLDLSGNGNTATGSDGGNNTGLTSRGETIMSYPEPIIAQ